MDDKEWEVSRVRCRFTTRAARRFCCCRPAGSDARRSLVCQRFAIFPGVSLSPSPSLSLSLYPAAPGLFAKKSASLCTLCFFAHGVWPLRTIDFLYYLLGAPLKLGLGCSLDNLSAESEFQFDWPLCRCKYSICLKKNCIKVPFVYRTDVGGRRALTILHIHAAATFSPTHSCELAGSQ